jgi:putative metallohydrolase (TIGR04338 family)
MKTRQPRSILDDIYDQLCWEQIMHPCLECDEPATCAFGPKGRLGLCSDCWERAVEADTKSLVAARLEKCPPDEDPQRQEVYSAEWAVKAFSRGRLTIPKLQKFVNQVLNDPWTRDHFGPRRLAPITVLPQRKGIRCAQACSRRSTIRMPTTLRSRFVALHEVAHILVDRYYGYNVTAAHGPQFAGFLTLLVKQFLGANDCRDLVEAYSRQGVDYENQYAWLAA